MLEGIGGESVVKNYSGEIDVNGFSLGTKRRGVTYQGAEFNSGHVEMQSILIDKWIDKASPNLMLACSTGRIIPMAVISCLKAGGTPLVFYKVVLKNAKIIEFEQSGDDKEGATESIRLGFDQITIDYQAQDNTTGKANGGVVEASFDLKKSGVKKWYHVLGEKIRRKGVLAEINKHNFIIKQVAQTYNVDAKLIKAIIYEEMTHQLPFESTFEVFGTGKTFGLGQVTEGYYGYSAKELMTPNIGIKAIGRHINTIKSKPLINDNYPIASIATKYNCGRCTKITAYGHRVARYWGMF